MLTALNAIVLATNPGDDLKLLLVKWVTPIILVVASILVIPHLIKGRFMAIGSFALVAVVVFIIFTHPEILMGLGNLAVKQSSADKW
jgi:hypothetical protein